MLLELHEEAIGNQKGSVLKGQNCREEQTENLKLFLFYFKGKQQGRRTTKKKILPKSDSDPNGEKT